MRSSANITEIPCKIFRYNVALKFVQTIRILIRKLKLISITNIEYEQPPRNTLRIESHFCFFLFLFFSINQNKSYPQSKVAFIVPNHSLSF